MSLEPTLYQLREFDFYRQMILNGEVGKRNTIVERKDGSHAIIHHITKKNPFPDMKEHIAEIERITVLVDGKEYEFVACQ